jgi:hypothetical protein
MASASEKGQVLVFISLWTHVVSAEDNDSASFCMRALESVLQSLKQQLVSFQPFDLGVKVENVRNKLSRAGVMDEFNGDGLTDEAQTKMAEMLRGGAPFWGGESHAVMRGRCCEAKFVVLFRSILAYVFE